MQPNALAARVAPRMMNDVVPPYADALPSAVAAATPPTAASSAPAPVNPMFAPAPAVPAAPVPAETNEVQPVPASAVPSMEHPAMAYEEPAPVAPHPDQMAAVAPVGRAPKSKANFVVISLAILVCVALAAAAYIALSKNS